MLRLSIDKGTDLIAESLLLSNLTMIGSIFFFFFAVNLQVTLGYS